MTARAVGVIEWHLAQHDDELESLDRRIRVAEQEVAKLVEARDAHARHASELREALGMLAPGTPS